MVEPVLLGTDISMGLAGCDSLMRSAPWVEFVEIDSGETDLSPNQSLALTDAGALLQNNPPLEGFDVLSVPPCLTATCWPIHVSYQL